MLRWYKSVSDSHRESVWQLREKFGSVVREIQVFSELERDVDGLAALERLALQMHLTEPAAWVS